MVFQHMPTVGKTTHPVANCQSLPNFLLSYTLKIEKPGVGKRQSGTARGGQLPTPATPKGRPCIRGLLQTCDILLCQEVILLAEHCCFLEGISDSFNFLFMPSKAPNNELGEGRPSGGMIVLYKKSPELSHNSLYKS